MADDRVTVQVADVAFSNTVSIEALVELLDEKGIISKQEILERVKTLGQEARSRKRQSPTH